MNGFRRALVGVVCGMLCAGAAHATWSIIAVDRETGEVGIAGASCTFNVLGIAKVEPGVGAVAVQAMSSNAARERGLVLLSEGASAAEIVEAMRDPEFDPENQQYAVVLLKDGEEPATYTGTETSGWKGSATGDGVSVQGNILASEDVVVDALKAFEESEGLPLSERLVLALKAGHDAGGDSRCGEQGALSAFVTVYKPENPPQRAYFHFVVYGSEMGGDPAVLQLAEEYERWKDYGTEQSSTRLYIIP